MSRRRPLRGIGALIALLLLVLGYAQQNGALAPAAREAADDGSAQLLAAFEARRSDLQLRGRGNVVRILPDDNRGSRHQRFLLETASGQSLLVAHNIDLAPRIPRLERGDTVEFFGEYEWNPQGGVIHWTHHDPGGRHVDGWLQHEGKRYD